jgi:hypothetical protein
VLMLVAMAVAATAPSQATLPIAAGLFLLGLAWCGMFVTGSGLLTEAVDEPLRPAAQSLSDTSMWIASAVAVGAAGWIIDVGGFATLAGICGLATIPVVVIGLRLSLRRASDRTTTVVDA